MLSILYDVFYSISIWPRTWTWIFMNANKDKKNKKTDESIRDSRSSFISKHYGFDCIHTRKGKSVQTIEFSLFINWIYGTVYLRYVRYALCMMLFVTYVLINYIFLCTHSHRFKVDLWRLHSYFELDQSFSLPFLEGLFVWHGSGYISIVELLFFLWNWLEMAIFIVDFSFMWRTVSWVKNLISIFHRKLHSITFSLLEYCMRHAYTIANWT